MAGRQSDKPRVLSQTTKSNQRKSRNIRTDNDRTDQAASDASRPPKRVKFVQHMDDGPGNALQPRSSGDEAEDELGHAGSDDDSEIDSDEAFGSSDEERFEGFSFRGSSSTSKSRKRKRDRQDTGAEAIPLVSLAECDRATEPKSSDTNSSSDDGEAVIDMVNLLDESIEDDPMPLTAGEDLDKVEHGWNGISSDDENEDDSVGATDDEVDLMRELARDQALSGLVSIIQGEDAASDRPVAAISQDINEARAPSQHNVVTSRKLELSDLIESVSDPQMKTSLKLLNSQRNSSRAAGGLGKLEAPLPQRQQDQLDRIAAYSQTKASLDRWLDTVKHLRRSDHLVFPLDHREGAKAAPPRLETGQARGDLNDLERSLQRALVQQNGRSGASSVVEKEFQAFEELQMNKMPFEEAQARRSQLRLARELLFREEMRAKRVKKIKSKSYRRVHRKERERLAQNEKQSLREAGLSGENVEAEEHRIRAVERMGLRHRESRWAKQVKADGRLGWDDDARDAVEQMAIRDEELRRRIDGHTERRSGGESSMEESELGDQFDETATANAVARELDRRDEDIVDTTKSGLFSMKFMQQAEAAKQAATDEALRELQRDVEGGGSEESASDHEPVGRRIMATAKTKKPAGVQTQIAPSQFEFEEPAGSEDDEIDHLDIVIDSALPIAAPAAEYKQRSDAKSLTLGNTRRPTERSYQVPANPWLSGRSLNATHQDPQLHPDSSKSNDDTRAGDQRSETAQVVAIQAKPLQFQESATASGPRSSPSAIPRARGASKVQPKETNKQSPILGDDTESDSEQARDTASTPLLPSQAELLSRAFATDDTVEAAFKAEKAALAEAEDDQIISHDMPGWGSWITPGTDLEKQAQRAMKKKRKEKELGRLSWRDQVVKGVVPELRRDAKLDKVIISEKAIRANQKYMADRLPHPFKTAAQYEYQLKMPIGKEWTTTQQHRESIKPRIIVPRGRVLKPLARPLV